MVKPHSSAFMKRRTVQPDDAAKGPHLRGQSCSRPAAQPGGGGDKQAWAPPLPETNIGVGR